jgi:hypothetical protein
MIFTVATLWKLLTTLACQTKVVASQVQALSCRVELLGARIQNRHDNRTAVELARDSSAIQASQAHQLKINNEILNTLPAKSVLVGTKFVLFGRYVLKFYVGIVQ